MAGLMIGEVSRRAGVAASTLRYYEKAGLLPAPARFSKCRRYDPPILGRIRIILLARSAGFSVSETRTFLNGFPAGTTPALRWRKMAQRKMAELDQLAARITQMKLILDASFRCRCRRLEDCERLVNPERGCANTARVRSRATWRTPEAKQERQARGAGDPSP
jgi:MerR family transcriptional regulator, redox-sensitive transcriptional activator SoxR